MLEEEASKSREGGDIRRKISTEQIGMKAQNPQGIQLPESVGRDGAREPNPRKSNGEHMAAICSASDAYPRCANRGSSVPVEFSTMRNSSSKVKKGLFICVQVREIPRKNSNNNKDGGKQWKTQADFHGE